MNICFYIPEWFVVMVQALIITLGVFSFVAMFIYPAYFGVLIERPMIQALRRETRLSTKQCRQALQDTDWDEYGALLKLQGKPWKTTYHDNDKWNLGYFDKESIYYSEDA